MNKKIFILLIMICLTFSCVYATTTPIRVQLNGEYIDFTDDAGNVVNPEMMNNRTMVPMRKIFEVVGADVEWNGEERKITATTEEKIIRLQIDNNEAVLQNKITNEEKVIELDAAPVILNNRTMVPVRFIAESLEKQVGWDNENRCVIVIDYSFIEEGIRENAKALVEFLETDREVMESFKIATDISGNISYKDDEKRDNNERVKINGECNIQKSKDGIHYAEVMLETTGDGEIQSALEEMKYDSFEYEFITNGEETYTKSSVANTKKWVPSFIVVSIAADTEYHLQDYIEELKVPEEELTINTYAELQEILEVLYKYFGNGSLKVSGTKNKRYEFSLDISQELSEIDDNEVEITIWKVLEFLSVCSVNLNVVVTCKDNQISKVDLGWDFYIENPESEESIKVSLNAEAVISAVNSDVKLSMPKASQIEKGD